MDLGIIITGLIIVLICVMPIVIIGIHSKKKRKRLTQAFLALAKEHGCTPSLYEFWYNSAIGIDKSAGIAILDRIQNDVKNVCLISLIDVRSCNSSISYRKIDSSDGAKVIDKLELVFWSHKTKMPPITWEIYNSEYDNATISSELMLTEKWAEIFNQNIANK